MFTGQSLLFSLLITIGLFFFPGYSYSENAPVKVNRVKFSRENILGLNNRYEIAIELEGGRVPGVDNETLLVVTTKTGTVEKLVWVTWKGLRQ